MKVILTQEDIEQALVDYVGKLVTVQEGFEISVEKIIAGRGDKGLTAEVDISEPKDDEPVVQQDAPKVRKPRQRKAKVETGEETTAQEDPKPVAAAEEKKPEAPNEPANPDPEPEDPPFVQDEEESQIGPNDGTAQTAVVKEPEPVIGKAEARTATEPVDEAPKRPSIFNRAQRPTNS